jgi:hypothetical protein
MITQEAEVPRTFLTILLQVIVRLTLLQIQLFVAESKCVGNWGYSDTE